MLERSSGLLAVATAASVLAVGWSSVGSAADRDRLSPRYVVEAIEVHGNQKTQDFVIRRALQVEVGQELSVDDPRFDASRYSVLALGFFSEVSLRLKKGSKRGRVILVVDVVERGTILLSDIFLGFSRATDAWGGIGLAEKNFLGKGIALEGAFVLGADPDVERGSIQQGYWARASAPNLAGGPIEANASFLFVDGNEFFRKSGPDDSSDPDNFLSIRYRRIGGTAGIGFNLGSVTRLHFDYRGEAVQASIPTGAVRRTPSGVGRPIDFGIADGDSVLSALSLTAEWDQRSDPVVPERGWRLAVAADASTRLLGSSYSYVKLTTTFRYYLPTSWGHIFAFGGFAGVVFGDAPFFERFFIGDLNYLVPARALGLNFATLPSRNVFGTSIAGKRYEDIALRTTVEYIIPWFRGGTFVYAGDFFINTGLIFLGSTDDLRLRDRSLARAIPIDLTVDAGLRLDTRIGIFRLSVGNALGRIPF